jgi:1-acyl-sn-glycerol-3-phosphate acyltransferase
VPSTATVSQPFRLVYGTWAWLILIFLVVPVAVGCLFLPGLSRRRSVARWGAAMVLRMIGTGLQVRGEPLSDEAIPIVVANHQSYLDGIILTAVLPPQYTFLIKREMVRVPIAGFVLSRLGSLFVDRSSANQRHRSARKLVEAARLGHALAVFPEGTFDEHPGLKPFHTGAFRAAFSAGLTIVPTVISGARTILPSGCWWPRPGKLVVEFRPGLSARDFASDAELMRAARCSILERLDEPDLAPEGIPAQRSA